MEGNFIYIHIYIYIEYKLCYTYQQAYSFFSCIILGFVNRFETSLLTNLRIVNPPHQDHMRGMHQRSVFCIVLWPPYFLQQLMQLVGYSPPGNNPD